MGVTHDARTLVISAVNLVEGGTLQVLRDCVAAAARMSDVRTIVLANSRSAVASDAVEVIEFPRAKKRWINRIAAEYAGMKKLSERLHADAWLSLHDMTPNVVATRQYVYCHNPSPFYRLSWRERWLDPKQAVFQRFYGLVYRINIRRNTAVIVQQHWLKREFDRRYHPRRTVTAAPLAPKPAASLTPRPCRVFLYPAFPRVFKNFEVLCEAARRLPRAATPPVEIRLTIDGTENRYARHIARLAAGVPAIRLIGRQTPFDMQRQYAEADAVLFPSKLETWGLPISEARERGKPILLADLDYAHETLGGYEGAVFLDPGDPDRWAHAIAEAQAGRFAFSPIDADASPSPDFETWDALLRWVMTEPSEAGAPVRSSR